MSFEAIRSGSVIVYPYLRLQEAEAGETGGRKARPTAVGVRLPSDRGDLLLLFPITSKYPGRNRIAAEFPDTENGALDWNLTFGSGSSWMSTTRT